MYPHQNGFRDVYTHTQGEQQVFCYRTGLTVYEEVFSNCRYTSAGWNAAGYTLNVLDDFPTRLNSANFREAHSFDVEVDGVSLGWDWAFVSFTQREEALEDVKTPVTHAVVTLKSEVKPVTVEVHTLLDGTDVFTRWIEVINTSDAHLNLSAIVPMCGGVETITNWRDYMRGAPDCAKIYSLGYMDQSTWGHEGYFKWHDLPNINYGVGGKFLGERHRHPMFLLRNNLLGTMMIAQLGWSGAYRFDFKLDTDSAHDAHLAMRLALDGQKPMLVLDPGERFASPRVHIGMLRGDLDDAINAMHAHLRRTVFTLPAARGVKGWVVGGMGPERLMDVRASKHFIDTLAAVGAETMIIDAGWYCPPGTECQEWKPRTGDWIPHPDRYPNGIGEVRDYAHEKGLLFGLWMDLERLGKLSAAAKAHPDWLSRSYRKELENSQIDMTNPEAVAWVESELTRVIETYKIDLFRLDYNLAADEELNCVNRGHGPENAFMRYYQNVTAMYRRLRRRFPDVVFENCASGGARTDVAFNANFTHTWVSDWNVAPRSFAITNGMTMALPPELVDRLLSGMNCHTHASLAFHVRNTIFGRPTTNDYNAVGSNTNPAQLEIVRHAFDIYKTHIRPYIDESKIYHHTPELVSVEGASSGTAHQPQGTGVIERASGDGKHGVLGVFNLADTPAAPALTVYPRGVNPALTYRVTLDNSGAVLTLTGYALQNEGIRVHLPTAMTSELIVYEAI